MAKLPTRRKIFDLAGEGHKNPDGSSRQDELLECWPGEAVTLRREPENTFDADAVAVISERGVCIGYLCREDAEMLAPHLDDGRKHAAIMHQLTGGVTDYRSYGARISLVWDDAASLAHVDLDREQEAFRARKVKLAGRKRDSAGRLVRENSGCLGLIVVSVISGACLVLF